MRMGAEMAVGANSAARDAPPFTRQYLECDILRVERLATCHAPIALRHYHRFERNYNLWVENCSSRLSGSVLGQRRTNTKRVGRSFRGLFLRCIKTTRAATRPADPIAMAD
ncbi:hypothetical protein EVAR_40676_1 [Eumeta japonica]|uniref:Uncharacterized protein n=1 Tax=Eumeta variegata TaxID=151549 RepID=A0A4C1X342_EUMVA|nr:hypothetical protein EVAR_40676_1 [Eumeta japonica]